MKPPLLFPIFAALLGGCAIVPADYGYGRDGYHRTHGPQRGGGDYRDSTRRNRTYRDDDDRRDRRERRD